MGRDRRVPPYTEGLGFEGARSHSTTTVSVQSTRLLRQREGASMSIPSTMEGVEGLGFGFVWVFVGFVVGFFGCFRCVLFCWVLVECGLGLFLCFSLVEPMLFSQG